jgi:hypothetical protein
METRSTLRTIIAALVGIGILIVIIVLMFRLFTRPSSPKTPAVNIGAYSDTASDVTLLVDAPTNINQDHRQVRITVSSTQNQIEILEGYQGNVVNSRTYPNNSTAYSAFLQALKGANFTKGDTKSKADYRGHCPLGERYVYTFNDGYKDLFSYWTTSCGEGTYHGNRSLTYTLFQRQIPAKEFRDLTRGIPLG